MRGYQCLGSWDSTYFSGFARLVGYAIFTSTGVIIGFGFICSLTLWYVWIYQSLHVISLGFLFFFGCFASRKQELHRVATKLARFFLAKVVLFGGGNPWRYGNVGRLQLQASRLGLHHLYKQVWWSTVCCIYSSCWKRYTARTWSKMRYNKSKRDIESWYPHHDIEFGLCTVSAWRCLSLIKHVEILLIHEYIELLYDYLNMICLV